MQGALGFDREGHRVRVRTVGGAVLLLLDGKDTAGALVGGQQVGAVLFVHKAFEEGDAGHQARQVVLVPEREDGRYQIVPGAALAQMRLQPVLEKGEKRLPSGIRPVALQRRRNRRA